MRKIIGLIKRNLLVYFKDRATVIFSMLTPIIILVLNILFLKDSFASGIASAAEGLKDLLGANTIDTLANELLLSGILGSALMTVSYNSLVTIVRDRENKVDYNILSTPLRRFDIVFSYFTASAISAFLISFVILNFGLILLAVINSFSISFTGVLRLYGITFLGALSGTALTMVIVIFFKSTAASGAFLGILSAAAGFMIGAYLPLSQFATGVRSICNLFPGTGVTALLRDALLGQTLDEVNQTLAGMDGGAFSEAIRNIFGFSMNFGERVFTTAQTCYYIIGVLVLSIAAVGILYPRVYKRN